MEKLYIGLRSARERVRLLSEITRWVWITNAAVTVYGITGRQWRLAAVAGITWIMTLTAAAVARRIDMYLDRVERTIQATCAGKTSDMIPAMNPLIRLENQ